MRKILCMIMAAALLAGGCGAGAETEERSLEELLAGMTLREKAAQMMLASFRVWKEVPDAEAEKTVDNAEADAGNRITELNEEVRGMIAREHFGGIVLFAENFADAGQTQRLVADMQEANRAGGGIPMMIAVDEEGGRVARMMYGTIGVGNMALGATGDPENARRTAEMLGSEIGLLGIGADFAPVVDVNNNAANPVIGNRSFSDDPQAVAEFGKAYIQGLHDAGIMATAKHFPGHGNTDTDSHTGFPVVPGTYEDLQAMELIPFRAAIGAGVDMVMTAHIQYPQIEKETYTSAGGAEVYLPATMSRRILTDILRGDMGFEGVIVSDALDMDAVFKVFSTEDMLRLAVNAGVDMLILPCVWDTQLFRLTETMLDTAVALVEKGEITEERINESVMRILKLKQKYGILDLRDFTVTEEEAAAAAAGIRSAEHAGAEWRIAEKALTLVKNENGAFPLKLKAGEKTLILFSDSAAGRAGTGDLARQMLEERKALPEGAEILVAVNTAENEEECVRAALEADHTILVHHANAIACLDPNSPRGISSGVFDRIIHTLQDAGKTVVFVSCELPYDAARFPEADAVLLAYWASLLQTPPAEGVSWSANLPAALLACFGEMGAEGKLPVNIPVLDREYKPTGEIMYPRER